MRKSSLVGALSLLSILALTGAGCQKESGSTSKKAASSEEVGEENESPKDEYKKAVDIDLPEEYRTDTNLAVRAAIEDVFGDTRVSTLLSGFPAPGSFTVEFTVKRNADGKDANTLSAALKKRGFMIEGTAAADGTVNVVAKNAKDYAYVNFTVGKPKVGFAAFPVELGEGSEE